MSGVGSVQKSPSEKLNLKTKNMKKKPYQFEEENHARRNKKKKKKKRTVLR